MFRTLIWVAVVFCSPNLCSGEEEVKDEKTEGPTSLFGTDLRDDVAQDVGSFAPSRTLLGKVVYADDGTPVGKVDDIVIDPYSGMATTLMVAPSTAVGPGYRSLLPIQIVTPIRLLRLTATASVEKIAKGPTIGRGKNAHPYRRQLAKLPFDYYGIKPAWASAPLVLEEQYDDEDLFVFANALRGTPVLNGNKERLGAIDDVTISWDNGKIAYAVVATGDDKSEGDRKESSSKTKRHAIPLGAFVAVPKWKAWVIELPRDLLDDTHAIPNYEEWPGEVSLGWNRYVQKRYGGLMLSGIQKKLVNE